MTPDTDGEGEGISEKDVFEDIEIEEQLGRGLSLDYGQEMGGGNSSGSSDEFPSRFNIEPDRDGEGRGHYRWRGANLVFEPDEPVHAQTAADDSDEVMEVDVPVVTGPYRSSDLEYVDFWQDDELRGAAEVLQKVDDTGGGERDYWEDAERERRAEVHRRELSELGEREKSNNTTQHNTGSGDGDLNSGEREKSAEISGRDSIRERAEVEDSGERGVCGEREKSSVVNGRDSRERAEGEGSDSVQETGRRLAEALKAYFNGFYTSQRACAKAFRIGRSTFAKAVGDPDYKFRGQGYRSNVLKPEEEERVARFIHNRAEVGLGLTVKQVNVQYSCTPGK